MSDQTKTRYDDKLAPKNEPWHLIRDAIEDLNTQESAEGVEIDMETWHGHTDDTCYQCLAGAVMSCSLDADPSLDMYPSFFPSYEARLAALDAFRKGYIEVALSYLDLMVGHYDLEQTIDVPPYEENPTGFKAAMLAMADRIEEAMSESAKYPSCELDLCKREKI